MIDSVANQKCSKCAWCCRLFVVNLRREEYRKKRHKLLFDEYMDDFVEAEFVGGNLLAQKDDGSCYYLSKNRCSDYANRPQTCREFSCSSKKKKFKEMIEKIKSMRKEIE
jgi:Fe-S-cluster containining protein